MELMKASTDTGNVSYTVPSLHSSFAIPTSKGVAMHNPGFATAASTTSAHQAAMKCAKGVAMLAWRGESRL